MIQRGLLLLKSHLDTFQRRYAYHLRQWMLDGSGIISHQRSLVVRQSPPLRIICQPAGTPEKVTIELFASDYVADLRAEVTRWWQQVGFVFILLCVKFVFICIVATIRVEPSVLVFLAFI